MGILARLAQYGSCNIGICDCGMMCKCGLEGHGRSCHMQSSFQHRNGNTKDCCPFEEMNQLGLTFLCVSFKVAGIRFLEIFKILNRVQVQ